MATLLGKHFDIVEPFCKPVDLGEYSDYANFVTEPMNLDKVVLCVKAGATASTASTAFCSASCSLCLVSH